MERYESIGKLLSEYRDLMKFSQLHIADICKIDDRTYRRWEKNETVVSDANIKDLAEGTKIPFEVLFRLNHGYPTLYNIKTQRYTLCPFDRDYVNRKIIQHELFTTKEQGNIFSLTNSRDIEQVALHDVPAYPYKKMISSDIISRAAEILPELNVIIKDPIGFYSGHMICFPISLKLYDRLRNNKVKEYEIEINDLLAPPWKEPMALHLFSLFSTCSTYMFCLIKRIVYFLILNSPEQIDQNSIVSKYSFTEDGCELCRKLGLKVVFYGHEEFQKLKPEVLPIFYETRIGDLKWLNNYRGKFDLY